MTYHHEGTEYLDAREQRIWRAVKALNAANRTTNSSQVSRVSGDGSTIVTRTCRDLAARGFLRNVSSSAAYHWRITDKPVLTDPRSQAGA